MCWGSLLVSPAYPVTMAVYQVSGLSLPAGCLCQRVPPPPARQHVPPLAHDLTMGTGSAQCPYSRALCTARSQWCWNLGVGGKAMEVTRAICLLNYFLFHVGGVHACHSICVEAREQLGESVLSCQHEGGFQGKHLNYHSHHPLPGGKSWS